MQQLQLPDKTNPDQERFYRQLLDGALGSPENISVDPTSGSNVITNDQFVSYSGRLYLKNNNVLYEVGKRTGVAFSANKGGSDQSSVAGSEDTLVTWSTDELGSSVFASNRFTPTASGLFLLIAQLRYTTTSDQTSFQVKLFKNGAEYKTFLGRASGTSSLCVCVTAIAQANGTTDYFEVYANHGSGTPRTIDGTADRSFFMGSII